MLANQSTDSDDLVSYSFCHGCRKYVEDGIECPHCAEAEEWAAKHAADCMALGGSF